jgi:formin 2
VRLVRSACAQLRECDAFLRLLQAVLELGNHLNRGTRRGAAAGFKLDTLLKLADVKGVDRKTSLLQFVVAQLLADDPSVGGLAGTLSAVRPAATMQLSAVTAAVGEIRQGLRRVRGEAEAARALLGDGGGEAAAANARFAAAMDAFHGGAEGEFEALEAGEKALFEDLKATSEYFGEAYVPADPARVVRTVRDFVALFERALADIQAAAAKEEAEAKKKATAEAKAAARGAAAPARPRGAPPASPGRAAKRAPEAAAKVHPPSTAPVAAVEVPAESGGSSTDFSSARSTSCATSSAPGGTDAAVSAGTTTEG